MNMHFKLMPPSLGLKQDQNFTNCLTLVTSYFIHVLAAVILQATLLVAFLHCQLFSFCCFFSPWLQLLLMLPWQCQADYVPGNSFKKWRGKQLHHNKKPYCCKVCQLYFAAVYVTFSLSEASTDVCQENAWRKEVMASSFLLFTTGIGISIS